VCLAAPTALGDCSRDNCRNQAFALKIPSLGSMSDMAMLRQQSILGRRALACNPKHGGPFGPFLTRESCKQPVDFMKLGD
jgi:hypothetical protein